MPNPNIQNYLNIREFDSGMDEAYRSLEKSEVFQEWRKQHSQHFLSHVFSCDDDSVQFGYCDKDSTSITTFNVQNGDVSASGEDEVFKEPGSSVQPIQLEKVKLTMQEALERAVSFQKEKHKEHLVKSHILILQRLPIGQVYNITLVMNTLHTLNIKIDSETGEVLADTLTSMWDFAHQDKQDYIG
jgi:hypothetical protein